ncbi:glutathione S-transferase [Paraglaciecola aquimarina]|uniref:Glutathione S-transferase n=1 Tax=Paraglaciecola algarum TaxID=3050085 RepID=A0ABS9D562_9ALTE|nr:glutathione S-transferase [Paraglaciecola sp. G1-23]MCF2948050.1 glutathione S-transferase [Paraglaciecola sp. G1-23]
MYTLYSMSGSCSTAIHILLNNLNIPVDIKYREEVDNYSDICPTGQVPALQTENGIMTEGAAIVQYLMDKHQVSILGDKAVFNRWLMFNYATLHPAYSKMFTVNFEMPNGEVKNDFMDLLAKKTSNLWAILDNKLAQQDFIAGTQVSILDYLITIYASWGNVFPEHDIRLGENVIRVIKHVMTLPEFQTAIVKENMQFSIPTLA